MSHIVTLQEKIAHPNLLKMVAQNMGLGVKENARVRLFNAQRTGLSIQLPNWSYPVVVTEDGVIHYDNFNGHWGETRELHKLLDTYHTTLVHVIAAQSGLDVKETTLDDGSTFLEIEVGATNPTFNLNLEFAGGN